MGSVAPLSRILPHTKSESGTGKGIKRHRAGGSGYPGTITFSANPTSASLSPARLLQHMGRIMSGPEIIMSSLCREISEDGTRTQVDDCGGEPSPFFDQKTCTPLPLPGRSPGQERGSCGCNSSIAETPAMWGDPSTPSVYPTFNSDSVLDRGYTGLRLQQPERRP
jgi:hypothetical protein